MTSSTTSEVVRASFDHIFVGATEVEFTINETLEPRKIGIHVRTDIGGGNSERQGDCYGLLERHAEIAALTAPSTPMPPFVAGTKQFLVPPDLLDELVKRCFNGCSRNRRV